jgi:hypothetical protein
MFIVATRNLRVTSSLQDTHKVLNNVDQYSVCAIRLLHVAFQDELHCGPKSIALVRARNGHHVTLLSLKLTSLQPRIPLLLSHPKKHALHPVYRCIYVRHTSLIKITSTMLLIG